MRKVLAVFVGVLSLALASARRESPVAQQMADAARYFLASLSAPQRGGASFSLDDQERLNWHYVPRSRKGAALTTLTPAQHKLAHALLATGLGRDGYIKATNIMYLEQILHEQENGNPTRDPEAYSFSIFGEPSEPNVWGWRVEGHHLSLNFTIRQGQLVSATPAFFGANPAQVRQGPLAGLRVLAAEEEWGRKLARSFQGAQKDRVIIDVKAPADIITGATRKASLGPAVGVPLGEMTKEQRDLLMELLEDYAQRLRPELAEAELAKLRKAGLDKIHFAWAGGLEPGQPHYYRIQGPSFVIEYDNTQNNANHIHTVWRNFENDFGLDLLREHYAQSHRHQAGH